MKGAMIRQPKTKYAKSGDVSVVHLALGWGVAQLKVGSFSRSERMAKWNEGIRIEEALGAQALPYPARKLFARPAGALRPHRIDLHVARAGEQIGFVHRERRKAPLPQRSAPALAKIDMPGVAPVGFAEGGAQAARVRRHQDQMNVIGHQTVGIDRYPQLFPIPAELF